MSVTDIQSCIASRSKKLKALITNSSLTWSACMFNSGRVPVTVLMCVSAWDVAVYQHKVITNGDCGPLDNARRTSRLKITTDRWSKPVERIQLLSEPCERPQNPASRHASQQKRTSSVPAPRGACPPITAHWYTAASVTLGQRRTVDQTNQLRYVRLRYVTFFQRHLSRTQMTIRKLIRKSIYSSINLRISDINTERYRDVYWE